MSVRDLFQPNDISVAWGDGFISLTAERGETTNGDFQTRDKLGFNEEGPGMAEVEVTPLDLPPGSPEEYVMRLTAGSPIMISQQVSTLDELYRIEFDALTQDESGTLSLFLDDQLLQTWDYSEVGSSEFDRMSFLVDDSQFWGRTDIKLALEWDANTGDSIFIDNWSMVAAVPEPSGMLLLAGLGMVAFGRLRRRSCNTVR